MSEPKVFVFVDDSNIFISAKEAASKREGYSEKGSVRLQFDNLAKLAFAGRPVGNVVVVGSIPPEEKKMWQKLEEAMGKKPELYERGQETGGEQGIDQCLQVHMLRARSDNNEPQIAVLLTGDGAGYSDGIGFHADLERMYNAGWGIEVLSWNDNCKKDLKEWAKRVGVFIPLDNYYNEITFIEGGRVSRTLALNGRPMAQIRKTKEQMDMDEIKKQMELKIKELETAISEKDEKIKTKEAKKKKYDKAMAKRK